MCQQNDQSLLRRRREPATTSTEVREEENETAYTLTRNVVSHHSAANDAWVIHNGSVYDITMFLESHPGGSAILLDHLGRDVTTAMDSYSDSHAHSPFAFKLLEKYRIGKVIDDIDGKAAPDGNIDSITGSPLVDWNKPILHQVGQLGEKYHKWIHSFPTTDHTVKMFTNDTLESLTKCPWYVPLLFWIPIIVAESVHYVALMNGLSELNAVKIVMSVAMGVTCWLLFEYSLHRWIFHWRSFSYGGNIIHFLIHGHHHITPMDFDRLVFPPVPALILAAPFWYGAPKVCGVEVGYPWLVGFGLGYLIYDMTHFYIHHGIPSNRFLKMQKRRHVHHHYFQPTVNFGISNPLFDYVFGTVREPVQ